jgi:hypothetical protein
LKNAPRNSKANKASPRRTQRTPGKNEKEAVDELKGKT